MSATPTIKDFPAFPTRVAAGSTWDETLADWWTEFTEALESVTEYIAWVHAQGFAGVEDGLVPQALLFQRVYTQCRLDYASASALTLNRYNGKWLTIDDTACEISSNGVSLAPTGLTALTLYYIYACMISGVMTLEASTTGYTADSRNGIMVKSSDATKTLVGVARTNSSGAWVDSLTQRFVISYYNRRPKVVSSYYTATRNTGASEPFELNAEIRIEYLTWEAPLVVDFSGTAYNSGTGYSITTHIYDSGGSAFGLALVQAVAGQPLNASFGMPFAASEGYHYSTVKGSVGAGSTGYWTAYDKLTTVIWG
jgi:hypothetical protein